MEVYNIQNDIRAIGFQVKTFPLGISEAFDSLFQKLPSRDERSYYGLSYIKDGKIFYFVAAGELHSDEAKEFGYDEYTIEKGEYLIERLKDWRTKLDSIKDILDKMMKDSRVDLTKQCVEWYKSDDEMYCMVMTKKA